MTEVTYSDKSNYKRAVKKGSPCRKCRSGHTLETRVKMSRGKRKNGLSQEEIKESIVNPILTRNCPSCQKVVTHKTSYNRRLAVKENRLCRKCSHSGANASFLGKQHTPETKARISATQKEKEVNVGRKSKMFGRNFYSFWVEKYGKEEADKRHILYMEKMLSRNCILGNDQSPFSSYSGWYKNWFFRSSKELNYALLLDKAGSTWQSAETIHIKYAFDGKTKFYSPDFLVDGSYLVEIKDKRDAQSPRNVAKAQAGTEYCNRNNLIYKTVDPGSISLDNLLQLEQHGTIKLTNRTKKSNRSKRGKRKNNVARDNADNSN